VTAFRRPMIARDTRERGRVSTPLELLFDLTFVIAVSLLVNEFGDAIVAGDGLRAIGPFLMTFFAIWWAWDQFAWLASAYDTDDVPYRLLTMVQMAGVLVLAAGVPQAFEAENWVPVTIGYAIMRIGLLASISRAAMTDPIARRYVIGIAAAQVLWLLRLFLPTEWMVPSFLVVVLAELAVPVWADRAGRGGIRFHPHHITERHGLFTLILLGESVYAASVGFRDALAEVDLGVPLVVVALAGLVILFGLWWVYFSEPAAEGLESRRSRSFLWAYGHFFIFGGLAAVGSGLEAVIAEVTARSGAGAMAASLALAIPLAIFVVALWAVHAPLLGHGWGRAATSGAAALLLAGSPLLTPVVGVLGVTLVVAAVVVAVVVVMLVRNARASTRTVGDTLSGEVG